MTILPTRRALLAGAAACLALPPGLARATPAPALAVTTRTLDIGGRAATVFGLTGPDGRAGLTIEPGARFRARLQNDGPEPTLVHWHGQMPPNLQDGVPDMPAPMLAPGEARDYDFAAVPGTHWMHAHVPDHEMRLLAAPLVVRSAEDAAADRQEVVLFLHDFSFAPLAEHLARLGAGGTAADTQGTMPAPAMDHGAMPGMMRGTMAGMAGMAMDLNDIDFDAYLANDRTLDDPEVVTVEPGGRVLLRVINAAAATVFHIDTGALAAELVAVDGRDVRPLAERRFGIAMGQRLDLALSLPAGGGAFPVFALREGARERTGIVLATRGAPVARLSGTGDEAAPAFGSGQEAALRALAPLSERPADRREAIVLGGGMMSYRWTIDGAVWGAHRPVAARSGERVVLSFRNMSMMGHPMHLHGHAFQVVGLDGRRIAGALRDTVYVPPMSMVDVALDAGEAARWMLHCHHMPHLATGMMTELAVSG